MESGAVLTAAAGGVLTVTVEATWRQLRAQHWKSLGSVFSGPAALGCLGKTTRHPRSSTLLPAKWKTNSPLCGNIFGEPRKKPGF